MNLSGVNEAFFTSSVPYTIMVWFEDIIFRHILAIAYSQIMKAIMYLLHLVIIILYKHCITNYHNHWLLHFFQLEISLLYIKYLKLCTEKHS